MAACTPSNARRGPALLVAVALGWVAVVAGSGAASALSLRMKPSRASIEKLFDRHPDAAPSQLFALADRWWEEGGHSARRGLRAARALDARGHRTLAVAMAERVLARTPNHPRLVMQLAEWLAPTDAGRALELAERLARGRSSERWRAVRLLEQCGRLEAALAAKADQLSAKPGQSWLANDVVSLLERLGRFDEAVALASTLAARDPVTDGAGVTRGARLLWQLGERKEALRVMRAAVRTVGYGKPLLVEALARMLADLGRDGEVDRLWKAAVLEPSLSRRYGRAGDFYEDRGDHARAYELLARHAVVDPRQRHTTAREWADAALSLGRPDEAVRIWKEQIANRHASDYQVVHALLQLAGHGRVADVLDVGSAVRARLRRRPRIWEFYAELLTDLGRPADAAALWSSARRVSSRSRRRGHVEALLAAGRFDEAERRSKRASSSLDATRLTARILVYAGRPLEAEALWRDWVERHPGPDHEAAFARWLHDRGRSRQALERLRGATDARPERAMWSYQLLDWLWEAGAHDDAVARVKAALAGCRGPQRRRALGSWLAGKGRTELALKAARRWASEEPGSIAAHKALVEALLADGRSREARSAWHELAALRPAQRAVPVALELARQRGWWDDALAAAPGAVGEATRARLLLGAGRLKEARRALKALARTGRDASAAARGLAELGDDRAAEAAWRRVLARAPGDVEAAFGLAEALERRGRRAEADAVVARETAAVPSLSVLARAADRAERLGRWDEAATLRLKAFEAAPFRRDAWFAAAVRGLPGVGVDGRAGIHDPSWRAEVAEAWRLRGEPAKAVAALRDLPLELHHEELLWVASMAAGDTGSADRVWDRVAGKAWRERFGVLATWDMRRGEAARAVVLAERQIRTTPASRKAIARLADAYLLVGREGDAAAVWRRAVRDLGPRAAGLPAGRFMARVGRDDEARRLLTRTGAVTPTDGRVWLELARVEAGAGRVEAADAALAAGAERVPAARWERFAALGHELRGRCDRALAILGPLLARAPADPLRFAQLRCLREVGPEADYEAAFRSAEAAFRARVASIPGDAKRLNRLAWLLAAFSDDADAHAEAVSVARKAVRATPWEPSYLGTLAVALTRAGEPTQALKSALPERQRLAPRAAWTWLELAWARAASGDPAGATKAAARFRELAARPDTPLRHALGMLARDAAKGGYDLPAGLRVR